MISMPSDDQKALVALVERKSATGKLSRCSLCFGPHLAVGRTAKEAGGLHPPYGLRSIAGMSLTLAPLNQGSSRPMIRFLERASAFP